MPAIKLACSLVVYRQEDGSDAQFDRMREGFEPVQSDLQVLQGTVSTKVTSVEEDIPVRYVEA